MDPGAVGEAKLARPGARLTPGLLESTLGVEAVDAGVAVAITQQLTLVRSVGVR